MKTGGSRPHRRTAPWRFAAALGLVLLAPQTGCETVDLGTPPADVNACRPSQAFYASDIGPKVMFKEYDGGKHCYDSNCHGAASNNSLKLILPMDPQAGTVPLPMTDWLPDYIATAQQMNCADVKSSKLYRLPTGLQTHGGMTLFAPDSDEANLILSWVGQP